MHRRITAGLPSLILIAIAIGGCWHEETNPTLTRPPNVLGVTDVENGSAWTLKYIVVATDGGGNLNVYGDDGLNPPRNYGAIAIRQSAGSAVPLGEVLLHQGRAFVLIPSGLRDGEGAGALIGGGVVIVDLAKAVANIKDASAVEIVPLVSNLTAKMTRITRAAVEPDGKYLWLSNAGPEGDGGSDSVFRLNWNFADATDSDGVGIMDDKYKDITEVLVGHGDKQGAYSHPVLGYINAPLQFAVCNAEEQTLSIVSNDHMNASFLRTVRTINLNASGLGNVPGGIDYSPVSGKFYVGIVSGSERALAIVNATFYTVTNITAGTGAGQIPVGGPVQTSDDGALIYMLGYKTDTKLGYLSILKASDDSIQQIIELGDVAAEHIRIARMNHGATQHSRLLIAATARGGINHKVYAVELDPASGMAMKGSAVMEVAVGAGHAWRGIELSPDHLRAYVPNGGDCGATPEPDCNTIAVLDVMRLSNLATLTTRSAPALSVAVLDAAALGVQPPPPDPGGGGGHQH